MHRLFAIVLILGAIATVHGTAAAADYRLLRLDGKIVKWGDPHFRSGAALTYALADRPMNFKNARNCRGIVPLSRLAIRSAINNAEFRRETRAAFDAWQAAADLRFVEIADPRRADIVIGAQRTPRGHAFANVSHAPNSEPDAPFHVIRKSLICLNPSKSWKIGFDGNTDIYDLRFTLIHEIGHAIGLDHAGTRGQLMGFRYHERFRAPQGGDVAGAVRLYGNVSGHAAAGAKREFAPATGPASRTDPILSLR